MAALALAPRARAGRTRRHGSRARRRRRGTLNYIGTIVYQHGARVETSRLVHLNDGGSEFEKLVNLDGPAREVIRSQGEVRCYYPDAKIVRIEPRTFRNVFPSLSPQQQKALAQFYDFRKAEAGRVAGARGAGVGVRAEGRPALRPQVLGRHRDRPAAQGAPHQRDAARSSSSSRSPTSRSAREIDRDMVKPTWAAGAARLAGAAGRRRATSSCSDTGWVVGQAAARASPRSSRASARCAASRDPVAHLVYSDGLVAVSVFIEPSRRRRSATSALSQPGRHQRLRRARSTTTSSPCWARRPAATVRQIAQSVVRR